MALSTDLTQELDGVSSRELNTLSSFTKGVRRCVLQCLAPVSSVRRWP